MSYESSRLKSGEKEKKRALKFGYEIKQGRRHRSPVLQSKKKKGKQKKKKKVSKHKLLKGRHQGQNVTVSAILERLELKIFSCRTTMVADHTFQCSMAPCL